jgi:hypothetical protein
VRRIVTWLLVGAVVALGAAAGVDALRGGGEPEGESRERERRGSAADASAVRNPVDPLEGVAEELRAAGVGGVLTYADDHCRVRSVSLPELVFHPGAEARACRFRNVAEGQLSFGPAVTSPDGVLRARCRGGRTAFRSPGGVLYARVRGCEVAWRGDSSPTLLRGGELVELGSCPSDEPGTLPLRCTRTLLAREDLVREFRRARWASFHFAIEEVQWLTERRFAVIVRARAGGQGVDLLAVFEGRRLLSGPPFGYEELEGLRPSPTGAFVTARILDPGGIAAVDRRGRVVRLALPYGHAVTWSPDGRWIAEAMEDGIVFFRADERSPRSIFAPIIARDLVWR